MGEIKMKKPVKPKKKPLPKKPKKSDYH